MAAFEFELAQVGNAPADDGREPPALLIGRLYERNYRMIRAICQLLLRNPADAEDAAQQTFLSAFGSLIDGTVPRQPAPWLATIARRECWARTAQRRRQPLVLDETNAPASTADNPLDEAIRNADLDGLWKAINALPRQQRAAFLMREFSGLSYAEVAEALGASESAIESLLVRARRQLRDGLEPVVSAGNLIATPLILLQHRLARLLGFGPAGAAATAATPGAARLGAAVLGAALVGSIGAGVGVHELRHSAGIHPVSGAASAPDPAAGPSLPDHLIGSGAPGTPFSVAELGGRAKPDRAQASTGRSSTQAGNALHPAGPSGSAPGVGAPTVGQAGGLGADRSPQTEPSAAGPSSPSDSPGASSDVPPTDGAPTDGTPGDTTPSDTTPVDTTPVDTTPPPDPASPDPAPGDPGAP